MLSLYVTMPPRRRGGRVHAIAEPSPPEPSPDLSGPSRRPHQSYDACARVEQNGFPRAICARALIDAIQFLATWAAGAAGAGAAAGAGTAYAAGGHSAELDYTGPELAHSAELDYNGSHEMV